VPEHRIFWGETHDNTYHHPEPTRRMAEVLAAAADHLDFYCGAYYTAHADAFQPEGHPAEHTGKQDLILEGWKDAERIEREWAEVQEATRAADSPGRFVAFPGYEWQGDGSSGDHNVCYLREGPPIFRVRTVAELYDCLRELDALAIPHHTAYRPGRRGRDWSVFDARISPYAEVFSVHGCSETDEELIGLRQNSHMGPGMAGGTYQDALDHGLHLGAICGTDNFGALPGRHGRGRMAALAGELTREALWEAFRARRVYGVTGDRIELDFTVDGAPMGSIIHSAGPRTVLVAVRGSDALDRIEILRNGRVIATHCHQGTWDLPPAGQRSHFKLRIELGWGPRSNELDVPDRRWQGRIEVADGRFLACEPCWVTFGQEPPSLDGSVATFAMLTGSSTVTERFQNANVFEFEAAPQAMLRVRINGIEEAAPIAAFAGGSRVLWYRDECVQMLEDCCGLEPGSPERDDVYHHMAYKAKLHRAVPEAAYTARFEIEDDEPFEGEIHYRVRVEQRNGQRAWSSPVWVRQTSGND